MSSPRHRRPAAGSRGTTGSRSATGSRTATRKPAASRPAVGRRATTRRRPRRGWRALRGLAPARWWGVALIGSLALLALAWNTDRDESLDTAVLCTLAGSGVSLTSEQIGNARTIAQVARDRGLPERATVIALATAMQESSLRNLDHGDRDSLGLFQQRPSQGWGSPEQVQDPVYAAGIFYDRLVEVPDWQTGELTLVADSVQRSAYPLAYARWTVMAEELTRTLHSTEQPCS